MTSVDRYCELYSELMASDGGPKQGQALLDRMEVVLREFRGGDWDAMQKKLRSPGVIGVWCARRMDGDG